MPLIRNTKMTGSDRAYHEKLAAIRKAHEEGKLGKSWYKEDPKTGKKEIRPKRLTDRL